MSALDSTPPLPTPRVSLLAALIAAVLLGAGALLQPAAVAAGWLAGFTFWSSGPIGAVALALIHGTTGGRWGPAGAPTLRLLCLAMILLPLFFVVLALSVGAIYPWARESGSAAPDVARLILNSRFFAALLGWSAIAALLVTGWLGLLGASLSLGFHGVTVSVLPVLWLLSIDPRFTDSGFGAEIAVHQILFALAAIVVLAPARAIALAKGDIAALLLASALGAFYLGLMTFIVKWYGDLPGDAAWYIARVRGAPLALLISALAFGAAAPIIGCAWERVRTSARAMRFIGLCTILGLFLHGLWLVNASLFAALAGLASLVVMGGASLGIAPYLDRLLGRPRSSTPVRGRRKRERRWVRRAREPLSSVELAIRKEETSSSAFHPRRAWSRASSASAWIR